jgi:hypothetical protein
MMAILLTFLWWLIWIIGFIVVVASIVASILIATNPQYRATLTMFYNSVQRLRQFAAAAAAQQQSPSSIPAAQQRVVAVRVTTTADDLASHHLSVERAIVAEEGGTSTRWRDVTPIVSEALKSGEKVDVALLEGQVIYIQSGKNYIYKCTTELPTSSADVRFLLGNEDEDAVRSRFKVFSVFAK